MSAGLTERDLQSAKSQAWHGRTNIVDVVTRENSMPYEVIESPIFYKATKINNIGLPEDVMIESPDFKQLIANDDFLPIGEPYGKTYFPSNIQTFWSVIEKGMGDTPYEIVSAGTVDNRCKMFASIKVSDGFKIGDREFKDFITILDSFDKSTSFQARYSSVCVVCANTYAAAMKSGSTIGKAKHTLMLDANIQRLVDAMDAFVGTSAYFKSLMQEAVETPCSRDEARAWLTGIEGRNNDAMTNGMKQKTARMVELFDNGKGNEGRTRLDAFSALTDFHSNESTNRKGQGAQFYTSEFGSSAQVKTLAVSRFREDWTKHVRHGERLLNEEKTLMPA